MSHVDHSEHSVQIVATEWGIADLRGRAPYERAALIIENCAHPEFRDTLRKYMELVEVGHTQHTLGAAFRMHDKFLKTGTCAASSGGIRAEEERFRRRRRNP